MRTTDFTTLHEERVMPDATALVGIMNSHIVRNLRSNWGSSFDFPPIWRLAKQVSSRTAPILIYTYEQR
jgi:hypothetical protein